MFEQFSYWSRTGSTLSSPISARIGLGRVEIPDDARLILTDVQGEKAFCTEKLTYIDPLVGPYKTSCLVDKDGDGIFDVVKAAPGFIWFEAKIAGVKTSNGETIRESSDSVKMQLIYQGYAGKTVKISYREFIRDMARPAYYQEASYEVQNFPSDINFKNVRVKLLAAGNDGITYEVLQGF